MKSIKQLADEIGVSKPAITKRLESLNLRSELVKSGNKLLIPEDVETALKLDYQSRGEYEPPTKTETNAKSENQYSENENQMKTIDFLLQQIVNKDQQIESLTNQNEKLLEIIANQEILRINAEKRIFQLEETQKDIYQDETPTERKPNSSVDTEETPNLLSKLKHFFGG